MMNSVKVILSFSLVLFVLSACTVPVFSWTKDGGGDSSSTNPDDSENAEIAKEENPGMFLRAAYVRNGFGDQVGYSSGWYRGSMLFFDPDENRYAEILPSTGQYLNHPVDSSEVIYFASAGCTGTGVVSNWYGEPGKSVIKIVGNMYEVTVAANYAPGAVFAAYSKYTIANGCVNSGYAVVGYLGTIVPTTAKDYTSDAPYITSYSN